MGDMGSRAVVNNSMSATGKVVALPKDSIFLSGRDLFSARESASMNASRAHAYNKRKAIVRRQKAAITASVIIILTIIIICAGMIIADAAITDSNSAPVHKYYTSIEIQKNDTLWDLAGQYKGNDNTTSEYVNEVMKLNNMTTDRICQGQKLIVFYYSAEEK